MKFIKSSIVAITLTATSIALAHGPGALLQQADVNKDGAVSKAEATQYADARFADADTNQDGAISQSEADAVKEKHRAVFEQRAQERFASKDTNKDGKLQQSEVPNMPEAVFKKLDANSDGGITADEFRAHGHGHRKGPHNGAKGDHRASKDAGAKHGGLFKRMDADQDGTVTKAEAQAASEQHFARLDRNGDGNITADEMPKGRWHGAKK